MDIDPTEPTGLVSQAAPKPARRQRRTDPDRRERIIDTALEVIAEHGIAGTTHRRVADAADVSLGSMTYHFRGMEDLLEAAFTRLMDVVSARVEAVMAAATTRDEARAAVVEIILGKVWGNPRTLLLSYELYAYASRHPALQPVMQAWMDRSRETLGKHFGARQARALDAFIEGVGIHNAADREPMSREEVTRVVGLLTAD